MSIRKLFGFGKPDQQTNTVKLQSNLAALLGAKEGESIEATASNEGVAALEQAEINLQAIAEEQSNTLANLKTANETVEAQKAEIANLQQSIIEKDNKIEELGNAPATNHTAPQSSDSFTGEMVSDKPLALHQKTANAEIEKSREKLNADKK